MVRRFISLIPAAFVCILLSACAPKNQMALLDSNVDALKVATQECRGMHPAVIYQTCISDGKRLVASNLGFEYMDLLNANIYDELLIAEKFDAHEITKEEAKVRIQETENEFVYKVHKRDAIKSHDYNERMMEFASGIPPNQTPFSSTPAPTVTYHSVVQPNLQTDIDLGYVQKTQNIPQPSVAARLRDCAPTSSCAGAFAR